MFLHTVTYTNIYRTRAIITRGLYTFYPLFEVHLCTVTFGLMYGKYSRAVSNQERVIVARVTISKSLYTYTEFYSIHRSFGKVQWITPIIDVDLGVGLGFC